MTTRVDVPANSTEEEYFQACHAAKDWMEAQPGTVGRVRAVPGDGPGGAIGHRRNLERPWTDLTPARQAAVITAVRAAANDECG